MARGGVDLGKEVEEKLHEFITYLKQKKSVDCLSLHMEAPNYTVYGATCATMCCSPHSSYDVAKRTILLLREVCSKTRWYSARYRHTHMQ